MNDLSLLLNHEVVVLGEIHGNHAGPSCVFDLVSALLATERGVGVGLELPESDTPALRRWIVSDGAREARQELLGPEFWSPENFDGRASQAMFELLEQLRLACTAGRDVDLFGIDRAGPGAGQSVSEERMAAAVLEARSSARSLVILVGNLHARLTRVEVAETRFDPMALHVRAAEPSTLTVDLRCDGGETWSCDSRAQLRCQSLAAASDARGLIPGSPHYDLRWLLGPAIPSPAAATAQNTRTSFESR